MSKPLHCRGCPLESAPGPIVWGEGPACSKLAIIGQNPGPDEISTRRDSGELGRPFVGPSGRILWRAFSLQRASRESFFVTNVVKCFVKPGQPVPQQAVQRCLPFLLQELEALREGTTILTVGALPFETLTGRSFTTVTNRKDPRKWLRGCVWNVKHAGPSAVPFSPKIRLIPTMHPSYLIQSGFRESPVFEADVEKAIRFARGGGIEYEESFNYNPSEAEIYDYVQECFDKHQYGVDIETPESAVDEEEASLTSEVPIQVVGISHSIGSCLGVPARSIPLLKGLFASHELHLFAFNWAFDGFHLGKRFSIRSKPFDVMLALNCLYSDLRPKDLGMACSLLTDLPFFKNWSKGDPNRYNAYDTFGCLWAGLEAWKRMKKIEGLEKCFWKQDMAVQPVCVDMHVRGAKCDVRAAQETELSCYRALNPYIDFWNKSFPTVDWQSPQQLLPLFQAQGLPTRYAVRMKKDKSKIKTPTLDEDTLNEYAEKFGSQTAKLILQMRKLKHAADFTNIYWKDGYSHPQYKIHGQKMGRIQNKDPDMQNIPEEIEGTHPRKIIVPDDKDSVIVFADFGQIEFWCYAFASKCAKMLAAKAEGRYIYGLFYEQIFNEPFFKGGVTKAHRRSDTAPWKLLVAKSGPLGMLYGRFWSSMADAWVQFGVSKQKAKEMWESFHSNFPEIGLYHTQQLEEAKRNGYLQNYFGRIRRFPNVAAQRNELLSFTGQANGADILRSKALVPLSHSLPDFGARLILAIHDSIGVSCPRRFALDCAKHVRATMESPIEEMNGFNIPAAVYIGENWNDVVPFLEWHG
jgi:uracil-DNA glycosylase family 4